MKKIILIVLLFITTLPLSLNGFEIPFDLSDFYLSGNLSCNLLSHNKKHAAKVNVQPGVFVSPAIGYRFCNGFRLEGEFGYRYNHFNKLKFFGTTFHIDGRFETFSGMANIYYDIPLCFCLKPYIGAGIGYAHSFLKIRQGNAFHKSNCNNFAWQLIAGIAYPIRENVDFAIEYRFFKNEGVSRIQNHDIGGSLRYYF
jgi:hypothetical protein